MYWCLFLVFGWGEGEVFWVEEGNVMLTTSGRAGGIMFHVSVIEMMDHGDGDGDGDGDGSKEVENDDLG